MTPGTVLWVDRGDRHRAVVVEVKDFRVTLAHATSVDRPHWRVVVRHNTPLGRRLSLTKTTYFYAGDVCLTWLGTIDENEVIGHAAPLVEPLLALAERVAPVPWCVFDDELEEPSPPADDDA